MREAGQINCVFVLETVCVILGKQPLQPPGLPLCCVHIPVLCIMRNRKARTTRVADYRAQLNRTDWSPAFLAELDCYITHCTKP